MAVTTKKLFPATSNSTTTDFSLSGLQLNNENDLDVYVTKTTAGIAANNNKRILHFKQGSASNVDANHLQVNDTTGLYYPAITHTGGTETLENYTLVNNNGTVRFNTGLPSGAIVFVERRTRDGSGSYTAFANGSTIRATDLNNSSQESNFTAQEARNKAFELEGKIFDGQQPSSVFVNTANIANLAVDTNQLAGGAVTEPKISTGAVTQFKIADGAVVTAKLGTDSVTSVKITDGNITTAKLANDAVTNAKIADNSIDSEHYVNGSIDTDHIGNSQVTSAKIADSNITSGKIASNAVTTTKITDNAITTTKINNSAVIATKIADGNITSGKLATNSVTTAKIQNNAVINTKIADNSITAAKIVDSAVTNAKIATNSVSVTKLSNNSVNTGKIQDGVVTGVKIANNTISAAKIIDGEISSAKIASNAVTTDKIADSELSTLAGMQSATASKLADSTALTADIADLNQIDGLTKQTTISDSDASFPTSGAVVDYVAAQIAPLGGLEVIATEVAFPNTQPSSGVVISMSDAGGVVVNGSGVSTTGRTVGGSTVTINGFPTSLQSKTMAAGVGLMVSSTGSSQTYNYHKLLAKEADVEQLSNDINDFAARYRVGSSNPTSDLDAGDLFFNTGTSKLLVYNATNTAWEEAQSIGNFFISTLSPAFNGSLIDFTLSNAPANAQQVLLSINGVVQKPNAGSGRPTEGFSLNGSTIQLPTGSAPATGSDYFAIVLGSTVNIGTPSNNTVTTAILQNGSVTTPKITDANVTTAKIANGAVTNSKIDAGAVTTASLGTNAVTSAKILDAQVTALKIADGNVTTAKIADANVTTAKIADDAVTTDKIADDAVTNAQLSTGCVSTNQIANGAILNADVNASAAIAGTKISSDFGSQNITTTGRLLLGTTTEGHNDADDLTIATSSGYAGITLRSPSDQGGAIFFSDATSGAGEYDGQILYSQSSRTMQLITANNPRLTLDSSGNLLSGTTSSSLLSNFNTNAGGLVLDDIGSGATAFLATHGDKQIFLGNDTSANYLWGYSNHNLLFGTNNQTRLTITSDGSVGIGVTSPAALTHIYDSTNTSAVTEQFRISGGNRTADNVETGFRFFTQSPTINGNRHIRFTSNGNTGLTIQPYETSTGNAAVDRNILLCPSGGKVGCGTSSPGARLSIEGAANNVNSELRTTATGVATGYLGANSDGMNIGTDTAGLIFKTGVTGGGSVGATGTIRMKIDSSGRVGINESTPANMIEVKNNTTSIHPASFRMTGAHQYAAAIMDNDATNGGGAATFVSHRISNSIKGDITFNGSVMVYGGTSDYRLKENVAPITDGIAKLKQLNPLRYNFIDNPSHTCEGFFAHEAQAICPQSATGTKDEIATEDIGTAVKKGDPVYQQMDYSKLVPLLTAALKESITKIETLETKVAVLEAA